MILFLHPGCLGNKSNFDENIFCKILFKLENHNHITPEENATHCVVVKINIFTNFQFERHKTGHNTPIISRENRKILFSSKTSCMSRCLTK